MAKTVDSFSTIEDLRLKHNEVALDVGDISGLNTTRRGNLTEAVNSINEREFFFQEFVYTNTTTNQTSITGADAQGNTLRFRKDRIQVFVRGEHLFEGLDYEALNPNSDGSFSTISFSVSGSPYNSGGSKAVQANDRIVVYAFTGSFLGVALQSTGSTFWILDDSNAIFNNNASGVILNGDNSSITTDIETGFTLQLAGRTFAEDDIIATAAGKKFQAPIISDGTAQLSSGSLTSAVNGTFSGTVQAEHLHTTDDLQVGDDASIGGLLNLTGNLNVNTDKFNVVASSGNTTIAGTLGVTGNTTLDGNVDLGNASGDTISIIGSVDTDIVPSADDQKLLGSSTKKWQTVFATTLNGNLVGDVTGNVTGDLTGDVKHAGSVVLDASTGALTGSLTGDVTGNVSGNAGTATTLQNTRQINGKDFNGSQNVTLDLDDIAEASTSPTNLFFTNARADARIANAGIGSLSNVNASANSLANNANDTGKILAWSGTEFAPVSQSDTDAITEGSNNLFYQDERVLDFLAGGSGTVNGLGTNKGLVGGTGITLTYNDSSDTITIDGVAQYGDDDVDDILTAGLGLTKTDTGSGGSRDLNFSVNTSNGIKIDGDDVELDYEVISSSSLGGSAPNGSSDPIGHLYFVI